MKTIAIALLSLTAMTLMVALSGCASTTLYRDGKRIARFQGNMMGLDYQDGRTRLRAATVDHSTATKASAERITLAGAAVSGASLLMK